MAIISPDNQTIAAGHRGRRLARRWLQWALHSLASHRLAALALTLAVSSMVATPALSADGPATVGEPRVASAAPVISAPTIVVQQDTKDAFDGGFVPPARQVIFPSIEVGLSPRS